MSTMVAPVEEAYFAKSDIRRSHSAKFSTRQSGAFHSSASASRIHDLYERPIKLFDDHSNSSTAPSSPRTIQVSTADLSCSSTPASHLSLSTDNDDCEETLLRRLDDDNDDIVFPDYNGFDTPTPEELEPPPSPRTATSDGNDNSTTTSSDPQTPEVSDTPPAADDTAVGIQPTRHVDYLSHDWREEDIWSSWKHIVANRDGFTNSARLENASWRTWIKAKNQLKTISPETLNWLKDCDVTWLYGPLLPGKSSNLSETATASEVDLGESNSFLQSQSKKKPILKKRSMSEVMLQKSLSSSSLVKQAAAAVQAQQRELPRGIRVSARPRFERAATDYVTFPFSSRRLSKEEMSTVATSSAGGLSPATAERKHIHFNESVEQCIAIDDVKADDDYDMDSDPYNVNYDSDSDDGMIMMKSKSTKRRNPVMRKRSSKHDKPEKKMLSSLPPTRLKYEDDDETAETAMKHTYKSPVLTPSSSQETLRPSKSKKMFFVDSEDEDENEDEDDSFSVGLRSPPPGGFGSSGSSTAASSSSSSSGFRRSISSSSLNAAPAGMKRTESGMFMPNDEGDTTSEGIVGFVLDTVNTAKDIAHVVWNVGWRR